MLWEKKAASSAPHTAAGLVVLGGKILQCNFKMVNSSLHILWGNMIPFYLQQSSASDYFPIVNKTRSSSLRHHQILLDYMFVSVKGDLKIILSFPSENDSIYNPDFWCEHWYMQQRHWLDIKTSPRTVSRISYAVFTGWANLCDEEHTHGWHIFS